MNQREYRIGPGAASLMLLVVVLSMSALSLRSQDVARQVAELNVSAEQSLARLDAVLADAARTAQGEADYLARVEAARRRAKSWCTRARRPSCRCLTTAIRCWFASTAWPWIA